MEDPFGQFVLVAFSPRLSSILNKPQISSAVGSWLQLAFWWKVAVPWGWGMVGWGKAPYPGQEQKGCSCSHGHRDLLPPTQPLRLLPSPSCSVRTVAKCWGRAEAFALQKPVGGSAAGWLFSYSLNGARPCCGKAQMGSTFTTLRGLGASEASHYKAWMEILLRVRKLPLHCRECCGWMACWQNVNSVSNASCVPLSLGYFRV